MASAPATPDLDEIAARAQVAAQASRPPETQMEVKIEDYGLDNIGALDNSFGSPKDLSLGSPKYNMEINQIDFLQTTSRDSRLSMENGSQVGMPAFGGFETGNFGSIPMPASMVGGHGMDLMDS
eukprot:SAG11_NODE_3729_length_2260_cov_1.161499_1_plen_123_part_01